MFWIIQIVFRKVLYTHGKKKVPKEMELPIYFAHSNYVINLSADHRVTFDPRDLRDDDDAEVCLLNILNNI